MERQTGRKIEALEPPTPFPPLLEHVWFAFCRLSGSRSVGQVGVNPISYDQIKSFMELTDTPLKAWEVDAIMRLDKIYMGVANG